MNRLQIAALAALLAAASMACFVRAVRPRHRSVEQIRELFGSTPTNTRRTTSLDRWIAARVGEHLHLIGLTTVDVASQMLGAFAVGTFGVILGVGSMIALGNLPLSPFWLVGAVAIGVAAAWTTWSGVTGKIERRRRDVRRATTDFVQLVAVGLTTDQSIDEAVQFALATGDSEVFDLLRSHLSTAPQRGVPLWEAIDQFGRTFEQRELSEFATSIERQGTQGVSITDTVNNLATAMRERALDDLERDADRANANLAGPTVCFVVTTVVFLSYPLAIRIGEAFGG